MAGEIVEVDLGYPLGHEAGGVRPALVINSSGFAAAPLRIVCPITRTRRRYPYRIEIEPDGRNGLTETSYVQAEHLRSLSVRRITRSLGALEAVDLMRVQRVLRFLLDH